MAFFQRGRFRNSGTGGLRFINMAVAAGIGVISGQYIFKGPIEAYWAERGADAAAGGLGGVGGGSGSACSTAVTAASASNSS